MPLRLVLLVLVRPASVSFGPTLQRSPSQIWGILLGNVWESEGERRANKWQDRFSLARPAHKEIPTIFALQDQAGLRGAHCRRRRSPFVCPVFGLAGAKVQVGVVNSATPPPL
ncbi:hypothetical protein B0H14DRAFT_2585622 [Mycena olivaceomarginata]|nr:hypothetical protein B0H14DRAFT_2585622 [Mycena olivaceomarginata]